MSVLCAATRKKKQDSMSLKLIEFCFFFFFFCTQGVLVLVICNCKALSHYWVYSLYKLYLTIVDNLAWSCGDGNSVVPLLSRYDRQKSSCTAVEPIQGSILLWLCPKQASVFHLYSWPHPLNRVCKYLQATIQGWLLFLYWAPGVVKTRGQLLFRVGLHINMWQPMAKPTILH